MPRVSRAIAVGYPHHITQRGNYRQTVFAEESDYARYLELLAGFAPRERGDSSLFLPDIEFTGLRPGEKLFEEILTAEEGTDASRHEKIFIARNDAKYTLPDLPAILDEFNAIISDPSPDSHARMKSLLRKYVKYYTHDAGMSAECRVPSDEGSPFSNGRHSAVARWLPVV